MFAPFMAIACADLGADPTRDASAPQTLEWSAPARAARNPGPPLDGGLMPLGGASIDHRLANCAVLVDSAGTDTTGNPYATRARLEYDEVGQRILHEIQVLDPPTPTDTDPAAIRTPAGAGWLEVHTWHWVDSCEEEHNLHVESQGVSFDYIDLVECDSHAYPILIDHETAPGVGEVTAMKNNYRRGELSRVRIDLEDDHSYDLYGRYEWDGDRVVAIEWGSVGTDNPLSLARTFDAAGWITSEEQIVPAGDPADPTLMTTRLLQWDYQAGRLAQFSDGAETMTFAYADDASLFPYSGQSERQHMAFQVQCPSNAAPGG